VKLVEIPIPAITIENFVALLERTLAEYPEGRPRSLLDGGCQQIACLVQLAEAVLHKAGKSEAEQARLFSLIRDLHKALAAPGLFGPAAIHGVVNKSADRFEQTVKQAYIAAGLELRMRAWPEEPERQSAKIIGKAFDIPLLKVMGLRDTAKRKVSKYPLLREQFLTALRELEQAFPGQPRVQYDTWGQCVAQTWKIKI
jgi:hypothetical protein